MWLIVTDCDLWQCENVERPGGDKLQAATIPAIWSLESHTDICPAFAAADCLILPIIFRDWDNFEFLDSFVRIYFTLATFGSTVGSIKCVSSAKVWCRHRIQHSWKFDNRAQEKYREQIYFVEVSIATSENFSNMEQFLAQCYRCHLCFNDELLAGGYFERFRDLRWVRSDEIRGVSADLLSLPQKICWFFICIFQIL